MYGIDLRHNKYEMMSAHDDQIGILWQFLELQKFYTNSEPWFYVPYASFVQIELVKESNCQDTDLTASCFYLKFSSNGQPLIF